MKTIKGYKGFDKDFKCRGFQFKEGETYKEAEAVICEKGFHFCENPLDVLSYYNICDSEFAEVTGSGMIVGHGNDTKKSATEIKIGAKLSLSGFIQASVDFLFKTIKPASGDYSQLAASGHSSKLEMTGEDSVGAAIGVGNTIKGKIGCWITLAEWQYDEQKSRWIPVCVQSARIDGKKVKADIWYQLKGGKFIES